MNSRIIEGKGLCKSFISGDISSHVIRNLDVEINACDFTVIMGASGAGKSTLLYMLSGIDELSSGEVVLNNHRIDQLAESDMTKIRRKDIGFIFQEANLLEDFTVFENIAMSGYLVNKNRKKVNELTSSLLEAVDVSDHHNKYPSQLSGGQKQRVAIARSLINRPKILFADEPTGALNATQSKLVLDLLSDFHQQGQTILMVTHDIKAAARANRLLYIKDGKIDGVLDLDSFSSDDEKDREKQVFDYVMTRGW